MTTTPQTQAVALPAQADTPPPAGGTELAVYQPGTLTTPNPAALANLAQEMFGLEDSLQFDQIKVPSGGGLAFELPGDDGDEVQTLQTFDAVILHDHPTTVLWLDEYGAKKQDGDTGRPDAWSTDYVNQTVPPETIEKCRARNLPVPAAKLADCPYFQWGSDPKGGRGKWTTEQRRVYVLEPGASFPKLLTLPPASLRDFGSFKGKRIMIPGYDKHEVLIRFGLKRDTNDGGITYSKVTLKRLGLLDPHDAHAAATLAQQLEPLFARYNEVVVEEIDGDVVEDTDAHAAPAPSASPVAATTTAEDAGESQFVPAGEVF